MSKNIQVTLSVKKRRALNEVDFAAAIDALANTKLEIKDPLNSLHNYTYDSRGYGIFLNGSHINSFLSDVRDIAAENAQYEREQTELRRANEHFADEHVRLSFRIAALARENAALTARLDQSLEANQTWEQRHTNVKAKLAAKDGLLNAAGQDLEKLRAGFAASERELARVREERDAISAERDLLAAARNNQRNTIIGMQQRLAAFDVEATRLREELSAERAERRSEAAIAAAQTAELRSQVRDANANFNLADRALSARNEQLAIANATLNDLRAALAEGNATAAKVVLTVHKNGSVTLDSGDAPVVLQGNVSCEGNLNAEEGIAQ